MVIVPMLPAYAITENTSAFEVRIAKWPDNRDAAFSFTFDDGYVSHFEQARPVLNDFGFHGTFYVYPGALSDALPGKWRHGTWAIFQEMADEGHEIGSHTVTHPRLTTLQMGNAETPGTLLYELIESKNLIEQRIPAAVPCITFAYPYVDRNDTVDEAVSRIYLSARGGGQGGNDATNPVWMNLTSPAIMHDQPRSLLSQDIHELYGQLEMIHQSILKGEWHILMLHEIVPQAEIPDAIAQGSWEPVSTEAFTILCQWMETRAKAGDIWVDTMGNLTRYVRERNDTRTQVLSANDDTLVFTLNNELDDSVFNYPLTVLVSVPDGWTHASVIQGEHQQNCVVDTTGGNTIKCRILPDQGIVTVSVQYSETPPPGGNP
ncbi:MAG: polysaccharide deacetylase family protein [Opitutales bacterium]|nr:polysaccharide deacetylase family protein [Opitutales bacterium]